MGIGSANQEPWHEEAEDAIGDELQQQISVPTGTPVPGEFDREDERGLIDYNVQTFGGGPDRISVRVKVRPTSEGYDAEVVENHT